VSFDAVLPWARILVVYLDSKHNLRCVGHHESGEGDLHPLWLDFERFHAPWPVGTRWGILRRRCRLRVYGLRRPPWRSSGNPFSIRPPPTPTRVRI